MDKEPMAGSEGAFTRPKLMLKNYIDGLALFEGGETKDVIRSGGLELWPGRLLVARVLNPDPAFYEEVTGISANQVGPVELAYDLTVYDESGNPLESLAIDADSGYVSVLFEESALFETGTDAPDYIIESFFRRYWLNHGPMSLAAKRDK